MPKYTLQKLKKSKNTSHLTEAAPSNELSLYERQVTIPINADILAGLEVGEGAEFVLQGKIISLDSRESEDRPGRTHAELEITSVEAYGDKGATKGESKKSGEREIDELADI